jgi:hypothetical protein
MTLASLMHDMSQMLGFALVPPTPAGPATPSRDPNGFGLRHKWHQSVLPRIEHIMNNAGSTTMWRNSDEARSANRAAPRHAGHRPRLTSGQRLAQALFDLAGPLARLARHGETQWSSATFTGSRHTFVLRFQGAAAVADAEALTIAISDDEVAIMGALIAELTVTRFTQTLLPEPEAEIEIAALLLDQP